MYPCSECSKVYVEHFDVDELLPKGKSRWVHLTGVVGLMFECNGFSEGVFIQV